MGFEKGSQTSVEREREVQSQRYNPKPDFGAQQSFGMVEDN